MPPLNNEINNRIKKPSLESITTGVGSVSQSFQDLLDRIEREGITGQGGQVLQAPGGGAVGSGLGKTTPITPTPTITPTPNVTPTTTTTTPTTIPTATPTAQDDLIDKLTVALSSMKTGPTTEEQLTTLREERGITGEGGLRETVGTFEDEIGKAQDLLSDLDAKIRRGQTREEARLAPQELVTGRQAELQAQSSLERGDVLSAIDTLQRGKERAERTIEREEADILTILGLREKAKTQSLDTLNTELSIRKTIRDLTKSEIPNVVSSQFDDQGNLTIITQDPNTGAFSTKVMAGIGKKAAQVTNIRSETDDQGNVTMIGIDKNGKPINLGTIEGVGKTKETEANEIALIEQTLLASKAGGENVDGNVYLEERRKSDLNPTEFDKRFGSLLSEDDRERFDIKGPEEIDTTIDEVKSVFQQLRELGVSRKEAEKQFKEETGAKKISDEIKSIIDSIY